MPAVWPEHERSRMGADHRCRHAFGAGDYSLCGKRSVAWLVAAAALLLLLNPFHVVTGSQLFSKDLSPAAGNSSLCPQAIDPAVAPALPTCPPAEQCLSDTSCPGSKLCCSSFRVNATAMQFCVGHGCVCPNISALCPQLRCSPRKQMTDAQGCSLCQCQSVTGTTGAPAASTGAPAASTAPASQTTARSKSGKQSTPLSFALYGAEAASTSIVKQRTRFTRALEAHLTSQYNLSGFDLAVENLQVEFLTAMNQSYFPVEFDLSSNYSGLLKTVAGIILADAHRKRISFVFITTNHSWPLTSGYLASDVSSATPRAPTTAASSSDHNTSIIIYACSGVGGILAVVIVVLVIILCKRGKSSGVEFYEDPAPGVRFNPSSGVLDQTISPAYPGKNSKTGAAPQLVFDRPLYENNPDTDYLVEDM